MLNLTWNCQGFNVKDRLYVAAVRQTSDEKFIQVDCLLHVYLLFSVKKLARKFKRIKIRKQTQDLLVHKSYFPGSF